jgi:hypothetical protein
MTFSNDDIIPKKSILQEGINTKNSEKTTEKALAAVRESIL